MEYDVKQRHTARGEERAAEAGGVGRCRIRPGGHISVPGKEVGSECK